MLFLFLVLVLVFDGIVVLIFLGFKVSLFVTLLLLNSFYYFLIHNHTQTHHTYHHSITNSSNSFYSSWFNTDFLSFYFYLIIHSLLFFNRVPFTQLNAPRGCLLVLFVISILVIYFPLFISIVLAYYFAPPNSTPTDLEFLPSIHQHLKKLESSLTNPNKMSTTSSTLQLYFYAIVASTGMFNFGYHLAELNALQSVLTCADGPADISFLGLPSCISATSLEFNFAQAILALGGIVGALFTCKAIDRFGRKKTMYFLTFPYFLSGLALFFFNHYAWLLIGRFLAGISTGGSCAVVPLYINEISPKEMRGALGTFSALSLTVGIFISSLLSYFIGGTIYWRFILGFTLLSTLFQVIGLPFIIESPIYEASMTTAMATTIPNTTSSLSSSTSPETIQPEKTNVGLWQFLTTKPYRPSFFIVMLCQSLQQLSGINAYFAYSFKMVDPLLPGKAPLFGLWISFFYILFNFIPGMLLERAGRRPLMLISAFAMAFTAALITLGDKVLPYLGLAAFVATLIVFTVGLSVIPFLYTGEVVEPEAIAAASSVAYVVNNFSNFLVLMITPVALTNLGSYAFLIFSTILIIGGILIYFCLPETKGKSSSQVVHELQQRFPIRGPWYFSSATKKEHQII